MKIKLSFFILAPTIICCGLGGEGYAAQQNAVWSDADSLAALQQFNFNNQAAVTKNRKAKLYSPPTPINADYAESPHQLRLLKTHKDNFDGTYHDRYDQYYKGLPVWGAQVIVHNDPKNKTTLITGRFTTKIEQDLVSVKPSLSESEISKIVCDLYQSQHPDAHISDPQVELGIYVDPYVPNTIAKLAYTVTFFAQSENQLEELFYIVDANNHQIYENWNDLENPSPSFPSDQENNSNPKNLTRIKSLLQANQIQTNNPIKNTDLSLMRAAGADMVDIPLANEFSGFSTDRPDITKAKILNIGSGLGGNVKLDEDNPNGPYKFQYGNKIPGLSLRSLGTFEVTVVGNTCFMKTDDFEIASLNKPHYNAKKVAIPVYYSPNNEESKIKTHSFKCPLNIDTSDNEDETENDNFSPNNDAMYAATNLAKMYRNVYGFKNPFLTTPNNPIHIYTNVTDFDNGVAFNQGERKINGQTYKWHKQILLGSGKNSFYAFTSIDLVGHEISHIFTRTHSNLIYQKQSGGINESFSDMAGIALVDYVRKQGYLWYPFNWTIGEMVTKPTSKRYRGKPMRYMCDPTLDDRSIDSAKDYNDKIDVHYSSGIFNKAFCLLSKTKGWSIEKAFTLFVNANADYWIKTSTFNHAACGVLEEAKKRKMPTQDVINAFDEVDVSTECESST